MLAAEHFDGIRRDNPSSYDNNHNHRGGQRELDELEASKTRQCLKKTSKFLFSYIGLVGLVVIYAVAGGFLFQLLEIHEERLNCQERAADQNAELTTLKQTIVNYIQNNVTPSTSLYPIQKDNTTVAFTKIGSMLYDFRDFMLNISSKYRNTGGNCSITVDWTYPNSLLFAITVITTIGYGNIT
jgi:hypothetical protein